MSRYVTSNELNYIDPSALEALLTRTGWRQIAERGDLFRVLESPDSNTDVMIPLNTSFGDYLTRLNEALVGVEENLKERAEILLVQLIAGPVDGLEFERDAPTIRGSIEWQSGEKMYSAARNAFRAAAKSTQEHLPYFGSNRQRGTARQYMDGLRMGQTREGSYVITALVPTRSDAEMTPLPGFEEYSPGFYRGVTANLMQASEAAMQAAADYNRTKEFDAVTEAVDYGVSSDLIDSLAELGHNRREVRIGVHWSPLVPKPASAPSEVTIHPDQIPALTRAAAILRQLTEVTTVTISGTVRQLEQQRFGETGISRIDVLTGTSARQLRVRLPAEQYTEAVEAHLRGAVLVVTGELSRERNRFWLYNARDINLVAASDIINSVPEERLAQLQLPFEPESDSDDYDS
jgi:hypothetical protein